MKDERYVILANRELGQLVIGVFNNFNEAVEYANQLGFGIQGKDWNVKILHNSKVFKILAEL